MNVNRKIKKAMALAMTGTVIASSIMYDVSAAEQKRVEKEETIYVKTDAAGSAEEIIVSNWLRNLDHAAELQDTSSLAGIENVKGDETFAQNGKNLTWKADGNDIYYQGKIDKELPVTVTVTYYLDGKEISPEDLSGKSGHVKIYYQYENKLKQGEVYVPFVLVTGLLLDNDSFRNVEVTNGKCINDGDRNIIIGFGLPGLKDNLDFDVLDLDIPDGFEVDADVTEFSTKISMTVATPLDLSDMGLDAVDSWDDLKGKMDELEDGITQLVDGSGELADGVQILKDGCEELFDGMTELDDGASDLNDGAVELDEGMGKLDDGISTLNTKKKDLIGGVKQLSDGLNVLNSKKKDLVDGVDQLADGAAAMDKGAADLSKGMKQLYAGITTLDQNRPELISGIQALVDGINQLEQNKNALTTGAKAVSDGVGSVDTNLKKLQGGSRQVTEGLIQVNATLPGNLDQLAAGLKQISDGIDQSLESGDTQKSLEKLTTTIGGYIDGVTQYVNAIYNAEDSSGYISDVNQTFAGMKQVDISLSQLIEQLENVQTKQSSAVQADTGAGTASFTGDVSVEVSFADTNAEAIAALKTSIAGNQAVLESLLDVQSKKESIPDELLKMYSGAYNTYSSQLDNCISELQRDISNSQATLAALQQTQTVTTTAEIETNGTESRIEEQQSGNQQTEIILKSLRELKAATSKIVVASEQIQGGYDTALQTNGQTITQGGAQIKEGMSGTLTAFTTTLTTQLTTISNGVKQENTGVTMINETLYGTEQAEGAMTSLENGSSQVTNGLETMEKSVSEQLVPGAKAVSDGITTLFTKGIDPIADGLNQLGTKLPTLNTGIINLKNGAASLYTGTGTLKSGASQLADGTTQLQAGAKELANGVQQLADGGNNLNTGVGTFSSGIQDLKDGSSQLKDGTSKLADGTGTLKEGTEKLKEGGNDLNDGAQELLDGANELKEGVEKFNEEGVEKITDFVDQDLQDIIDRLKVLQDVSGTYKSFSSESDENSYSVKFIIETRGIE